MKISTKTLILLLISFPLVFCTGAMALEPTSSHLDTTPSIFEHKEEKWGIGFAARMASIPFKGDDSSKNDFIPLLYFEGEYLFLDGLEGGIKLLTRDNWQLRLLARWRFFDVPDDTYDAQIDTDVLDWGLQIHYQADQTPLFFKVDLMTDERQRLSSNWLVGFEINGGNIIMSPYMGLRFKDSRFNDYYYGLTMDDVGSGMDVIAGIEAKYHLFDNVFLLGSIEATRLDSNARNSFYVEDEFQENIFLGISYQNAPPLPSTTIKAKPYIRVAHGWATPSDLSDIISFNRERDHDNNQLTSIFYGHPLADDFLGVPLESYLTPGIAWHWNSGVQQSSQEFVLAIKHYYTFDWPFTWRFGMGEGLSYAGEISYIEQEEMDRKKIEANKWLFYLDFSLDFDLGKTLHVQALEDVWLGYSVHHRSGIFGNSSIFGNIKGGSNYNIVYLQYHF
ncbi:outer membrane protein V [Desulfocapsa sulfexigens DSM 10523]|uniref:Outer membrane protein V n=1 Tax=Desulfocapsa sulfexigens (strain DSM 10523 / SB164P1) TaxID=1167006 RepID=M1PCR1_DESSD|nr:MipA/OmpV family protein [Desulfocapsa sulfexigens]AGF79397.1 outer membrane protein V [Desulfocapsa sulfexigens DSM 10523]